MNTFVCPKCHSQKEWGGLENYSPLCSKCYTPMYNLSKIVGDDLCDTMLENIKKNGVDGTFKMIDRTIHNPIQRCKYRKIFFETVKKFNLKDG